MSIISLLESIQICNEFFRWVLHSLLSYERRNACDLILVHFELVNSFRLAKLPSKINSCILSISTAYIATESDNIQR